MTNYGQSIEQYEIKNVLGKGGFSTVYRAYCTRTGQEVAIKKIDKQQIRDLGLESRVWEETRIHSSLKHPAVLELYTCFEDKHYVYLILELCHNGELQRYLTTKPVLSEQETSVILSQVVEALQYLHSHGILHRDLSLANLLLTEDMTVRIADFGLSAELIRPGEKHYTFCGTLNYISPEVATGEAHGLETDMWGLGVMMYAMLVGRPPFERYGGVRSTITDLVMSDVKFPESMSIEARDLITKLLKKNQKDRIKITEILDHPFLAKNNMVHRTGFNHSGMTYTNTRCISYDSGISSSCQMSSASHSRPPEFPSVSMVPPVLNGALRRHRPESPLRSMHSRNTPCCNGHLQTNTRNQDCSHCFQSADHVCVTNECRETPRGKIKADGYADYAVPPPPRAVPLFEETLSSSKRYLPILPSAELNNYYAEQPNSYRSEFFSECGGGISSENSNCSHAFKTCAHNQCSHAESCSCLHDKVGACSVNNGRNADSGPCVSSHSRNCQSRQKVPRGNFPLETKLSGSGIRSLNGTSQQYSNVNVPNGHRPGIQIPPLFAKRLRPVRQKTTHVIFNILDSSEVCLEFLKKNKDGVEKVSEVLRISSDGMRIVVYHPSRGRGVTVGPAPPALPKEGVDGIYSYENIPEKLWKKYSSASKFVSLVKSKTPKVTYYSGSGKCFLMENGPDADFELCFYEGGKITKTAAEIKLIECNGNSLSFEITSPPRLSASGQLMWEHFMKCLNHCQCLEATVESMAQESDDTCFPLIVGRRPQQYSRLQPVTGNKGKENKPLQSTTDVPNTMGGFETSFVSTRAGSAMSKGSKGLRECNLTGIGTATQLSNGDIDIYSNGSRFLVKSTSEKVYYLSPSGQYVQYEKHAVPPEIEVNFRKVPHILKALKDSA